MSDIENNDDYHCFGCDVFIPEPTPLDCRHQPLCEKCTQTCIYCKKLCCPECCYNDDDKYDLEKVVHDCNKKCSKYKSFSVRPQHPFKVQCKYRYCIDCIKPCEKCNVFLTRKGRDCKGCKDFTVVDPRHWSTILTNKAVIKILIENEDTEDTEDITEKDIDNMLQKHQVRFMVHDAYIIWTKHCEDSFRMSGKVIHYDRIIATKEDKVVLVYVSGYGLETLKDEVDIVEILKKKGYDWIDDGDWHQVDHFGANTLERELTQNENFDDLANFLLYGVSIKIGKCKVEISEIEFYMYDIEHQDSFAHKDEHQLVPGCFYFHRQNGKSYKGGTYKGLDITFRLASSSDNCYGGILIRSIKYKDRFIEGPCKVVDFILEKAKKNSIDELTGDLETPVSVNNENFDLRLVSSDKEIDSVYIKSPRVGLTLSKCKNSKDDRLNYIMRPYRYCTIDFSEKVKKYKCLVALNSRKGIKKDWEEAFERGKTRNFRYFKENGISSVANLCEFYGFWTEKYE